MSLEVATPGAGEPPSGHAAGEIQNVADAGKENLVLLVYHPGCVHCRNYLPEYVAAAEPGTAFLRYDLSRADADASLAEVTPSLRRVLSPPAYPTVYSRPAGSPRWYEIDRTLALSPPPGIATFLDPESGPGAVEALLALALAHCRREVTVRAIVHPGGPAASGASLAASTLEAVGEGLPLFAAGAPPGAAGDWGPAAWRAVFAAPLAVHLQAGFAGFARALPFLDQSGLGVNVRSVSCSCDGTALWDGAAAAGPGGSAVVDEVLRWCGGAGVRLDLFCDSYASPVEVRGLLAGNIGGLAGLLPTGAEAAAGALASQSSRRAVFSLLPALREVEMSPLATTPAGFPANARFWARDSAGPAAKGDAGARRVNVAASSVLESMYRWLASTQRGGFLR